MADIEKFEYKSYLRFLRRLKIDAKEFTSSAIKVQKMRQELIDEAISENENNWLQIEESSQISDLLKNNKEEVNSIKDSYINDILEFDNMYNDPCIIDWEFHKIKAKDKGISVDSNSWKKDYLASFPIRLIYDSYTDVNVSYKTNEPHIVTLSQILYGGVIKYVFPLIFNYIFSEENFNKELLGFFFKFPTESELEQTANDIISVIAFLGYHKNLREVKPIVTRRNSAFSDIYPSCIGFLILHEYAHILLKHVPTDNYIQREVDADIFALNIYLDKNLGVNKDSEEKDLFAIRGLLALFPPIIMKVLGVFDGLNNWHKQVSHPHPLTRYLYVAITSSALLEHYENGHVFFDCYLSTIHNLFERIYQKLGLTKELEYKLRDHPSKDFNLVSPIFVH